MVTLLIDRIDERTFTQLNQMALHLFESPAELARFLLAAGMYHANKISFQAAADLSGLSFDGFKKRLREYFSMGYIIAAEVAEEDIHIAKQSEKG
ncbi:MAG: hypothetical protein Q3M30_03085 [Candidatus Electrothrix sp. Rat3]|nr:hypothetical protein [Candidatus Electrothrix rattekaaiensis]